MEKFHYKVSHQLADLVWVDFGLGYSTILPRCIANYAQIKSPGTTKIKQSQPNQGP